MIEGSPAFTHWEPFHTRTSPGIRLIMLVLVESRVGEGIDTDMFPLPSVCHVPFSRPAGAAGTVLLKFVDILSSYQNPIHSNTEEVIPIIVNHEGRTT